MTEAPSGSERDERESFAAERDLLAPASGLVGLAGERDVAQGTGLLHRWIGSVESDPAGSAVSIGVSVEQVEDGFDPVDDAGPGPHEEGVSVHGVEPVDGRDGPEC